MVEEEEEQKRLMLSNLIGRQLMRGVFPKQTDITNVKKKYPEENIQKLLFRVRQQDQDIFKNSFENYISYQKISDELTKALNSLGYCIDIVSLSVKERQPESLSSEVEGKINEFNRIINQNNEKIKSLSEKLPEIQRKKKENDDFFKKFVGEKKVWLDRLKALKLQGDANKQGFKYLYEAKTIKLLLEGILLEKVQDSIEKVLCEKGAHFGWSVMDEHKLQEERKKEEFEFNLKLANMADQKEADRLEKKQRKEWDITDRRNAEQRQSIQSNWKQIWTEIWIPGTPLTKESNFATQREFVKKVTMDVTFNTFINKCFDVWKFKNQINSANEYVILDKMRKYFPEKNINRPNRDEGILDILMDMIENIKNEEEVIYCNLEPARKTLREYRANSKENSAAIDRLELVIQKINLIQSQLKENSSGLIRCEVEEIHKLIKAIPDSKEQKLFKDNFLNESRLYDRFLPLTNLLMVVSFISIGEKRNRGYEERIVNINKEISDLKMVNNEITGKLKLLTEMSEKMKEKQGRDLLLETQEEINEEFARNVQVIQDIKENLNKIIELKNKIEKSKLSYYKKLKENLIKLKEL